MYTPWVYPAYPTQHDRAGYMDVGVMVRREEALGSCLRIVMVMRRIEPLRTLKV